MQSGTLPGLLLAVRGDTTAEQAIVGIMMVFFLVAVCGLAWLVSAPLYARSWSRYERRLLEQSQEFRGRWPGEHLRQAPAVELQAEIERCWQLVLALEHRMTRRESPDVHHEIAAVRVWIRSVADALNAATAEGR
ncbi:hypothetical protein FR943_02535 [Mycobacterium sp. TNTM28]|uniref:Uncharacterized protein n=1 Tax=[Mycobacterium] fortunisiensis TaxID=2600579 RepID=A0ABS6KGT0_9MYCO|nr:hypothetical protein [[Mycobacterium] fortunisiensis]MBU9762731.1 hypothetical protein [[Mycobacterium] fortunisiensis]